MSDREEIEPEAVAAEAANPDFAMLFDNDEDDRQLEPATGAFIDAPDPPAPPSKLRAISLSEAN